MYYKYDIVTVNENNNVYYIVRKRGLFGFGKPYFLNASDRWKKNISHLNFMCYNESFTEKIANIRYKTICGILETERRAKTEQKDKQILSTLKIYKE